MATFEFCCRRCKETFAIPNLSFKESKNVKCAYCKNVDVEMVAYDRANQQAMTRLAKELAKLQRRVDTLVAFIEECAEEEGAPPFEDIKETED